MNKKLFIYLGIFISGIISAMIYNYFYNMNGRYVPFRTSYKNVRMSYLDTRTGKIYIEVNRDGKSTNEVIDLQDLQNSKKK